MLNGYNKHFSDHFRRSNLISMQIKVDFRYSKIRFNRPLLAIICSLVREASVLRIASPAFWHVRSYATTLHITPSLSAY